MQRRVCELRVPCRCDCVCGVRAVRRRLHALAHEPGEQTRTQHGALLGCVGIRAQWDHLLLCGSLVCEFHYKVRVCQNSLDYSYVCLPHAFLIRPRQMHLCHVCVVPCKPRPALQGSHVTYDIPYLQGSVIGFAPSASVGSDVGLRLSCAHVLICVHVHKCRLSTDLRREGQDLWQLFKDLALTLPLIYISFSVLRFLLIYLANKLCSLFGSRINLPWQVSG